ncbi:MAG: radical SAM protein [Methanosarcinales archaeon]|nr:radical SAM protein [Methanosarcinales archaeon]
MHISYLAVSANRCTIQFAGCNFNCRGCFSNEKRNGGIAISAELLATHIPINKKVMLAGGEPTLDKQGLLSILIQLDGRDVILSTNGYLLDESIIEKIKGTVVHIDLKALDPDMHKWYTGKDNKKVLEAIRLLYEYQFEFEVNTVYIPGIVEIDEIQNIARFLSDIGDIKYKIIRYVPVGDFSRRPEIFEIENAMQAAGKYLKNVSSSIENRSHPKDREIISVI